MHLLTFTKSVFISKKCSDEKIKYRPRKGSISRRLNTLVTVEASKSKIKMTFHLQINSEGFSVQWSNHKELLVLSINTLVLSVYNDVNKKWALSIETSANSIRLSRVYHYKYSLRSYVYIYLVWTRVHQIKIILLVWQKKK